METDVTKVVVTQTPDSTSVQVHHRDFSEIRAQGGSVREACEILLNHLSRALDTALTDWRRDTINKAIADVNAFNSSQGS